MDEELFVRCCDETTACTTAELAALDAALAANPALCQRLRDHRWLGERLARLHDPHRADFAARVHSALASETSGSRFMRRVRSATRDRRRPLAGRWPLAAGRWALVAAGLMAAMLLGLLWRVATPEPVPQPLATLPACIWQTPQGGLRAGPPLTVTVDSRLIVSDGHGSQLTLDGPALLGLADDGAPDLGAGQLRAELVPGSPRLFRAGPLAVEVLGTIFDLGYGDGNVGPWLLVERGAVSCREHGGAAGRVTAGGAWVSGLGPLDRVRTLLGDAGEGLRWTGSHEPAAPSRQTIERVPGAFGTALSYMGAQPGSVPWSQAVLPAAQDWSTGNGLALWHRGDAWQLELIESLPGEPLTGFRHQERFAATLPASSIWRWTYLPWSVFLRRSYQESQPQVDGLTLKHLITFSFLAPLTGGQGRLEIQDLAVLGRRAAH